MIYFLFLFYLAGWMHTTIIFFSCFSLQHFLSIFQNVFTVFSLRNDYFVIVPTQYDVSIIWSSHLEGQLKRKKKCKFVKNVLEEYWSILTTLVTLYVLTADAEMLNFNFRFFANVEYAISESNRTSNFNYKIESLIPKRKNANKTKVASYWNTLHYVNLISES